VAASLFVSAREGAAVRACRELVHMRTESPHQYVDLAEIVAERERR
jgi:hypothetical protein